MANLLYRASATATIPSQTSVKGAPLTNLEVDGNFRSIQAQLDNSVASNGAGVVSGSTWDINILGNAGTVTNGVYTNQSYANPNWLTSLSADKITNLANGPKATTTTLGFVKIGSGINVATDGTISTAIIPVASTSVAGTVKIGSGINVATDGTISVPLASSSTAGAVKIGSGINVATDGTISVGDYVTLGTAQTVTGTKVFSAGVGVLGQSVAAGSWTTIGWTKGVSMPQGGVFWWPKGSTSVSKGIGSTNDNNIYFISSTADSGAVAAYPFTFNMSSGEFTATGDVGAFSDARLKTNVEQITNAVSKVQEIRGVTFDRIDTEDGRRHTGVIAQEVERVLPEAVQTTNDGIKTVAYGNIVGLLIEAIKELKAEVEELKKS